MQIVFKLFTKNYIISVIIINMNNNNYMLYTTNINTVKSPIL